MMKKMTNLLTCLLTANDCYKANRRIAPRGVMVHSTGANNPMLRRYVQPIFTTPDRAALLAALGTNPNGNHWNRTGTNACVHGFIGKLDDGTVTAVQTLPWNWRGWHAGKGTSGRSANDTHISFEICEDGLCDSAYFTQAYRTAVELTACLCKEYGLNPLEDGVVICHSEGYRRGIASGHADVEHWFPRHGKTMSDFRTDVAREMEDSDMDKERFKELWQEMCRDFRDNDSSEWSEQARQWAVDSGLIEGGGDANFMWEDLMTREQLVTVLFRFAQLIGTGTAHPFE